ncbi:hypothetical protein [Tepidibacillus sp. LV47]|uniref:hypothetical protein n=1 Tax=Tepidibacillus sp. LV47 TaxID=3398228 RepID=UPI003AAF0AD8
MSLPEFNRKFTYSDYLTWDVSKRFDLIDGIVYDMTLAPPDHQRILGRLFNQFSPFFDEKRL